MITPTGGGKSYLVVKGLLKLPALQHTRVLLIDDKHTDPTTQNFGVPVTRWPSEYYPRVQGESRWQTMLSGKKECPDPEHYRLLVPGWPWSQRDATSAEHAQQVVLEALEKCYKTATPGDGWVIVIDETRTLTDSRAPSLGLAPALRYLWRMGRYRHVTIIALTQIPLGVPGEMYDQPTFHYFGFDSDGRRIDRFAEMGGTLPRAMMREVLPTLDEHEFLFLGNRGRHASIVQVGRENAA